MIEEDVPLFHQRHRPQAMETSSTPSYYGTGEYSQSRFLHRNDPVSQWSSMIRVTLPTK